MRLPLGSTPGGALVVVDTAALGVLCLVGDAGRGKTTLARHILRWWLADQARSGMVLAEDPHQYADLRVTHLGTETKAHSAVREPPSSVAARSRWWLTVLDGADALAFGAVQTLVRAGGPVVVTSYGAAARSIAHEVSDCLCLGLLPRSSDTLTRLELRTPVGHGLDVDQGRLDWPSETVHMVPSRCGEADFPRHRWEFLGEATG